MPTSTNPQTSPLQQIAETTCRELADAHPAIAVDVVEVVVLQAAGELAGRSRSAEEFGRLLRRRAGARLAAMDGVLTPIRAE
ncbi:hypothetical protein [Actinokineospora sp. NBRC 105648]|uniref:hypothetical protein n=1 Tax=Actinokineospora sp. NBRC 105648 TaxID=3032206 RepID=UPI0024A28A56|nr:hypothetical protein [Actinokineospora sp. NBRC 105648]GLZ42370.1 hypothetical protein Acsp05_59940 [Actinokineospora sp. NBRC 105648]